jgi:hypothetical protein
MEHQPIPHINEDPEPLTLIDSSIISTFRSCRKKFYWSYVQKLKPLGQSIHLVAGGAFASGIEAARIAQFNPTNAGRELHIDELSWAAMAAFSKAWGDFPESGEEAKNFHNTFHALESYLTEFPPYRDMVQPVIKPDGLPATEFSFAIPLPVDNPRGEPYLFAGRFDLLGRIGDLIVVQDEKTTSALGPSWMRQWDLRGQFLGYVWACRQLGYAVDHCVVRGIAIQKTQHQFLPVPVQYSQHLVDRWYEELLHTCHEINDHFAAKRWPYNFADACSSYGGCSFHDLCLARSPEPWLSNYESNTWSPISLDGGG